MNFTIGFQGLEQQQRTIDRKSLRCSKFHNRIFQCVRTTRHCIYLTINKWCFEGRFADESTVEYNTISRTYFQLWCQYETQLPFRGRQRTIAVWSTLLYGSEIWSLRTDARRLLVFELWRVRRIGIV